YYYLQSGNTTPWWVIFGVSFPPDLIRGIDAGVQLAKILTGRNDAGDLAGYVDAATLGGARAYASLPEPG
ncbi:hypothetical protein ACKLTP_19095, partial [Paenarthrobacter ureafaciens]|uniref:hypothetical protein n=1 Tax=Paenarthrobacter ureafaciens TaxID=37931 RepID=UPI003978EE39